MPFDTITLYVGAALTLLVLVGYLLGENNFLFRLATYLFVGAAAGYIFILVIYQVILPRIVAPLLTGDFSQALLALFPLVLSILLLFKIFPRISQVGNVSMAFLVGVGAAVIIGGAVLGTLLTQVRASASLFSANTVQANGGMAYLYGAFVLVGTLSTLAYFNFGARAQRGQAPSRPEPVNTLSKIGQLFIAVTLGALFAGVFTAALTAMIERLGFLWHAIQTMLF